MASPAFGLRASEVPFPFGAPGGYGSHPNLPSPSQYVNGPFFGQYGSPLPSPTYEPPADMYAPPMPYRSFDNAYASTSRAPFDAAPAPRMPSPTHGSAAGSDDEPLESAEMTARPSTRSGERMDAEDDAAAYEEAPSKRKGKRASVSQSSAAANSDVRRPCA